MMADVLVLGSLQPRNDVVAGPAFVILIGPSDLKSKVAETSAALDDF